ncbi:TolC family protein [Treponema sp.]|uniref:TolC family protein n=1 Tax=Treponema sp. TaxID=166 RepID=UPI0025DF932E|nr:TolC family protein [Treponema sp.]MBR4322785.1 TolC family protein [Treponema sp.]
MKKLTSLILIGFVAVNFTFAQDADSKSEKKNENTEVFKLSIDEAVDYALEHSRTLKSNDIDLEIKERASKYSWNVFLPNVQLSGTMSRANEYSPATAAQSQLFNSLTGGKYPVTTDYADEEARWSTIGNAAISWNFTPAYVAQIKIAKAQYEAGKVSWEQSQRETITNIKKMYYGLLLQQESLKIQKTTLENARQRMIQAQANFKNGAIPEIQYLQTQVNYENTKPDVDSAEQSLVQQMDLFAFMLGMPVGSKIELTSPIEPTYIEADADDLLAKYADNDLQIQSLEKNKLAAKLGITASDLATWLPTFALSYGWQPVYIGSEGAWHFYKDLGKDEKWYDSGSLSLTLVWNLTNMLPWSSNRQKVKDYKQQLAQLDLSIQTLKEKQKVDVRKAVDTLRQAREQIDAMGRNVTLAQRAYDMTARSYRNGTTELLDLRDAESSLNQAKLGQLNQKFQYISALMDLENTLNVNLTENKQ